MRLVLDTNTVVSGTLWGGNPQLLLDAAYSRRFVACTCRDLLIELLAVLSRPKFANRISAAGSSPHKIVKSYRRLVIIANPRLPVLKISRDPKDDVVLACAIEANANAIVSGDKDLLSLSSYRGVHIITAKNALARLPSD